MMKIDRRTLIAGAGIMAGGGALGSAAASHLPVPSATGETFKPERSTGLEIAMLVYPGMTMLDIMGPYHFLGFLLGEAKLHFVTNQSDLRPIRSDAGFVFQPTVTMAASPRDLDLLIMPGGGGSSGVLAAAQDPATIAFVRDRAGRARYVSSVCSGALILGTAGLLRGRRATSHWTVVDKLARFGATPTHARVIEDGNVITSAGVSAGLDLALTLVDRFGGRHLAQTAQLISEYAPEPPFNTGSVTTAPPALRDEILRDGIAYLRAVDALRMI